MKLGYNIAERLIVQLEAAAIVGPNQGSKVRDVLINTESELEQHFSFFNLICFALCVHCLLISLSSNLKQKVVILLPFLQILISFIYLKKFSYKNERITNFRSY